MSTSQSSALRRPLSLRRITARTVLVGAAAVLAVALSACSPQQSPVQTTTAPSVDVAAAKEAIAPFIGQPTAFPVDQPLSAPLQDGIEVVYLQCGTPVCALQHDLLKAAVETAGGSLTVIDAGSSAESAQAAAASALALAPDAVILTGLDPALFGDGLQKLSDAGVKVVSLGITTDTASRGIDFNYMGVATYERVGALMANWVIAREGADADVVFYAVPAITFSSYMQASFEAEMAKNCPSCAARSVEIDVATIGTTAPQAVVTDLQAHPETNTAVFALSEIASGLPAALRAANITVSTIGYAPTPGNLEDIKKGDLTAAVGVDFAVGAWVAVDAVSRLIIGDPLLPQQESGEAVEQILEKDDITFDVSHGFVAYPDVAERFAKLWLR